MNGCLNVKREEMLSEFSVVVLATVSNTFLNPASGCTTYLGLLEPVTCAAVTVLIIDEPAQQIFCCVLT